MRVGLPIGDGEVAVSPGGDGRIVVERDVDLRVRSGSRARLTVDLRSSAWMPPPGASVEAIAEAAFASAVAVRAE